MKNLKLLIALFACLSFVATGCSDSGESAGDSRDSGGDSADTKNDGKTTSGETSGSTSGGSTAGGSTGGDTAGGSTGGDTAGDSEGAFKPAVSDGACPATTAVTACKIVGNANLTLVKGSKGSVIAAGFDDNGRNNCASFEFSASNAKVTVDAATGEVTAADAGSAEVSVKSGSADCGKATVTVLDATDKLRVTVLDPAGNPVKDASITVFQAGTKVDSQKSAADGSYSWDGVSGKATVMVEKDDHNIVVLMDYDLSKNKDILVKLEARQDFTKSGGIKGNYAFQYKLDPPDTLPNGQSAAANVGIGGSAIEGSIFNLSLAGLLGDNEAVDINGSDVDLPSSLYLDNVILDIGGLKDEFKINSTSKNPVIWGFGGSIGSDDLTEVVGAALAGGDIDAGEIIAKLLPYIGSFNHGIITQKDQFAQSVRKQKDNKSADCINRLGNDCISDTDKFESKDLKLGYAVGKNTKITIPTLPKAGSTQLGQSLILALWDVPFAGMVPAGISAGIADKNADETYKDTISAPITLNYSPGHTGLQQSELLTAVVATDLSSISGGGDSGTLLNVVISRSQDPKDLGASVTYADGFLGFAEGSAVDIKAKTMAVKESKGANLYKVRIDTSDGYYYEIYSSTAPNGTIPDVANVTGYSFANNFDGAFIQTADMGNTGFEDLFAASNAGAVKGNAQNLNSVIERLTVMQCTKKGSETCKLTK